MVTIQPTKIVSRSDLLFFLEADRLSCGIVRLTWRVRLFNPVYRFQRILRFAEYYSNASNHLFSRALRWYHLYRLQNLRVRLGFTIPRNVFGPGLSIAHYGTLVVNASATIGRNCRIHPGVCIGSKQGKAPRIGNNVYIGPGAKLIGEIEIGDNAVIGANAVVVSDVGPNTTVAGIPARKVSDKGSEELVIRGTELVGKTSIDWSEVGSGEISLHRT